MTVNSVLITGANRGIGFEFVRQFAGLPSPPKHIFATCRQPSAATALNELAASNKNVHVLELDATDYKRYDTLFEEVKNILGGDGLDLLINNAGMVYEDKLDTVTPEFMAETFAVNTIGPLMCSKAARSLLRTSASVNGRALIVNISSGLGSIEMNNFSHRAHYSYRASKAALNMMAKSLSVDLIAENILVVGVAPGWVRTDMGGQGADLSVFESVSSIIDTIQNKITPNLTGHLINRTGELLPF